MSNVTEILSRSDVSELTITRELFQLVYDELRKIAAAKMKAEACEHTLQPTALVHDAFIRLVDQNKPQAWKNRRHFFSAAAEAMRRILIESARRRTAEKRGGKAQQVFIDDVQDPRGELTEQLLDVDETLDALAKEDPIAAELVKLRLFAGLSITDAGLTLGLSRSTAYENWKFARAWFAAHGRGISQAVGEKDLALD
jgi:RNA polymerase sigma factor (TIGR02999 family)